MNGPMRLEGSEDWAVIADLDGTIIDSERRNFLCLNQLLDEFGLMDHRETILKGLAEGREFDSIMQDIDITQEFRERMEGRMISLLTQAPTPSLPEVTEHLRFLRGLGILFCMATDNYSHLVSHILKDLALDDIFDDRLVLTSDSYQFRKPSPEIVRELLSRSGRSKAIVLGNTPKEVALARNSGVPAIIITDGKGMGGRTAKRKDSFCYEWMSHGGLDGKDVFLVQDWEGVKEKVIEIISEEGDRP